MANNPKYFIVNANFVKLRKAVGLTQEEFSVEIGIKRSLLGAYEEHRAEVKTEVLKRAIDKGYVLPSQVYDILFVKKFKPTPTKHFKKVMLEVSK